MDLMMTAMAYADDAGDNDEHPCRGDDDDADHGDDDDDVNDDYAEL